MARNYEPLECISFRVQKSEKEALIKKANRKGMTLSAFLAANAKEVGKEVGEDEASKLKLLKDIYVYLGYPEPNNEDNTKQLLESLLKLIQDKKIVKKK